MLRYAAAGFTAATATTIDHALFGLWNPSANRKIGLKRVQVFRTSTGGSALALALRRTTARGTPGSTITPTIVDDFDRALAPASGALFDMAAYTVQPTLGAGLLNQQWYGVVIGAGFTWFYEQPLWIPPGEGVCVCKPTTLICSVSWVSAEWVE